jgi:protein O-mannosyl-transferase
MTPRTWLASETRQAWVAPAVIVLLALAASVTSIGHDFTYDDRYIVLLNDHVHSLKHLWRLFGQTYWPKEQGSDGYRPFVMVLFTLQWVVGSGAPWVFHLVNILMAIGAALAVYWCARAMLAPLPAGVAAALFAVHPVHVEVTGNIVGQSEMLVAIFLCLAVGIYVRARQRGALNGREYAAILALYVLGLLSKEHAIVLPVLLAAAEWTLVRDTGWRWSRPMRVFTLLLAAISLAFLLVISLVHHDSTGFNPYPAFAILHMTALDRAVTMLTVIPRVGRLLVFPTQLSGDYSPSDVLIAHGFDIIQLPGLFICIGMTVLAFALRRKSPVASFGLFWTIISYLPVSNLLVPAGFLVAERTLFFPSVGVVLIAGAVVAQVRMREQRREQWVLAGAAGLLLALGLGRSIDRQRVWKNNVVFFDALIHDAPNSYRAHYLRAKLLGEEGKLREMEVEYHRAIRLFPFDVAMVLQIASDYHRAGNCRPVIPMLRWAYAVMPEAGDGRVAYVQCLVHADQWTDARTEALAGLRVVRASDVHRLRALIAQTDSALGRRRPRSGAPALGLLQTARDSANSRIAAARPAGN